MATEITVKYLGIDDWDRAVYEDINKPGRCFKRYEGEKSFYTAWGFDGEPEYLVKDDVIIRIKEDE